MNNAGAGNSEETRDPDYQSLQQLGDGRGEVNESLHREDARDMTVQRIQKIIENQFSFEIELKEKEVLSVNKRVHDTRRQLDRLRACILTRYYGHGGGTSLHRNNLNRQRLAHNKATCRNEVMKWKQSLPFNLKEHPVSVELSCKSTNDIGGGTGTNGELPQSKCGTQVSSTVVSSAPNLSHLTPEASQSSTTPDESISRFYVKRRVIVGNTSKYILPEHRERNDRSTHKWMVYVRGPKDNADLQSFISKVWFLLHPSYQPNDLVEVCKPPFQVTRRGWGEFPVRVQLHFAENRNKRVDIIHHLKLDKTYTGLQTLGAETHVDIELDRKNFDSAGPSLSNQIDTKAKMEPEIAPDGRNCELLPEQTSGLLPESEHHYFNDHSYSAPAVKKMQSCEEGSKYPTPPTSGPGSRSTSPETTKDVMASNLTHDDEVILRKCVQRFPIIKSKFDPVQSPYCASNVDQYFGWHLGKRLAAEWQRALAVKKYVITNHSIACLSTKTIMNYCRFHGYTPLKNVLAEGKVLCKVCGEEIVNPKKSEVEDDNGLGDPVCDDCDMKNVESLSCGSQLLEKGELLPNPEIERDKDDMEVCNVVDLSQPPHQLASKLLFLPMTEELEWIQETTAEIDVHLQGTTIDGVRAPVTTAMLHKACSLMIEDILRKASKFMWKTPSVMPKSKCILPTHIKQAVNVIPHCDFLSDKYLGVVKPPTAED